MMHYSWILHKETFRTNTPDDDLLHSPFAFLLGPNIRLSIYLLFSTMIDYSWILDKETFRTNTSDDLFHSPFAFLLGPNIRLSIYLLFSTMIDYFWILDKETRTNHTCWTEHCGYASFIQNATGGKERHCVSRLADHDYLNFRLRDPLRPRGH